MVLGGVLDFGHGTGSPSATGTAANGGCGASGPIRSLRSFRKGVVCDVAERDDGGVDQHIGEDVGVVAFGADLPLVRRVGKFRLLNEAVGITADRDAGAGGIARFGRTTAVLATT